MKLWHFLAAAIFSIPTWSRADTHVINQIYFLQMRPDKEWASNDRIIVLGGEKISIDDVQRARRRFPKTMEIDWLFSDEQWYYSNILLNKDLYAIEFAKQLEKINIKVLPTHLCPKTEVIHEKTHDIVVVDASWILFPHRAELFSQECGDIDASQMYKMIEEAILNAKLKPLVIISSHGIHPKLFNNDNGQGLSNIANQIGQSFGALNSISNPAYQNFQEKLNKLMNNKKEFLFLSANTNSFFHESDDYANHIGLSKDKPDIVTLENGQHFLKITSDDLEQPITLEFNETGDDESSICTDKTSVMYNFKNKGKFYDYFLGSNYRQLWNQKISKPCFNIEKENFTIDHVEGSLRSPDFTLKDGSGNFYKISPLKKEIRMPRIFRDTIIERIVLDQQSSILPVGYILSSYLSKRAHIPSFTPKLIYVDTSQHAFLPWRSKKFPSGFYQFVELPENILKKPYAEQNSVVEMISTQEMVKRLENESGYEMDQRAYLKARLFDLVIGDWNRNRENWKWMVIEDNEKRIIRPFPIDREAAFYHSNGRVSWWRRQPWIDYKLQDYGSTLHHIEPMLLESLSMDHRFTFKLSDEDWDDVLHEVLSELTPDLIERAITQLPIQLPLKDIKWLTKAYQKRLKDLPRLTKKMEFYLHKSVDIVTTADDDEVTIQSGPGPVIHVTSTNNDEVVFSNDYPSRETKEIRIYTLDGDDHIKLDWKNYVLTKVRIIPGKGTDTLTARDQIMKPRVSLYDDDLDIDSYYGFIKLRYQQIYDEPYSQINQRKLNYLAPVLFLASSDADSGFVLGGGVKYFNDGFQHSPWASTNEIKANIVLNRSSANILYQGVWFDFFKTSDLQFEIDAGIPRFYGSFFGLGNNTPGLDSAKGEEYYWMRAKNLEFNTRMTIPIFQNISLVPRIQFRLRDYLISTNSILSTPSENNLDTILGAGTNANIKNTNYYLGMGGALRYVSDDDISGPVKKRIVRAEVRYMFQQGLAPEDHRFETLDANVGITGYVQKSKTQWKISGGTGRNFGDWEFFDAQYLGDGQNLRGFFRNRFAGKSRVYDSFELNQSFLFKKQLILTDYGIGAFFDNGRVFLPNDIDGNVWHYSVGLQAYVTILNTIAGKVGYSHAIFEDEKGLWGFVLTTEL